MKKSIALLIPLILMPACNFDLFSPDETIVTIADVAQIEIPDTVNYFESFQVRAEVIMDHTCKYAGPIMEASSDGCIIRISAEVVEVDFHQYDVREWHAFNIRPLKKGRYVIIMKNMNAEDLVVSTYVR